MEINPFRGSLIRRRRGYNRVSPKSKSVKVVKFGTGNGKGSWRLRLAPKLKLRMAVSSLKLWNKLKNGYMNMMLRLANSTGTTNTGKVFGNKRIPQGRDVGSSYSRTEFDNRLIFEIYKSMVASYELGYTPSKPIAITNSEM